MNRTRIGIIGDDISGFHLFNCLYRSNDRYTVECFLDFQPPSKDPNQNKSTYPQKLSGDLYPNGITIYDSFLSRLESSAKSLEKVVFSPASILRPQYLFATAEFMAMDSTVVTPSLESTQLDPPKQLVSFFSNTQFDIPILLRLLENMKETSKPIIVMPGPAPLFPSTERSERDLFFFIITNKVEYQDYSTLFKVRHEKEVISALLENEYIICFVYDFQKFSQYALETVDFNTIVFVGFNSVPCFYNSHYNVFACDDFTFGENIASHPSSIHLKQADIVLYAHIKPLEATIQKINDFVTEDTKVIPIEVQHQCENIQMFPSKVALLIDHCYPTYGCNSAESISKYIAEKYGMIPLKLDDQNPDDDQPIDEWINIYGAPNDHWPAIILPETEVGVTNLNEHILGSLEYNHILACISTGISKDLADSNRKDALNQVNAAKMAKRNMKAIAGPSKSQPIIQPPQQKADLKGLRPSKITLNVEFEIVLDNLKLDLFPSFSK